MTGEFSPKRSMRVRDHLGRLVDSGFVPGALAVLARPGDVRIEAAGNLAFEGPGSDTPMAADTICRIASMSKPVTVACAMTLVEDGTIRLDEPVGRLLPELADMRVLADPGGALEDTVPAKRAITVRDVLGFTLGTGMVPDGSPIAAALDAVGEPEPTLDEYVRRLGALPLVHQPGERWMYNTAANVTGALIARATGMSFGDALRERVFEPLGMRDTRFHVDAGDLGRFATAYAKDDAADGSAVVADPPDGLWSRPPVFEEAGGGLVSTANDFLAFGRELLSGKRLLSRAAVDLMTTDHLTPGQKSVSGFWPGYFADMGWGFGMPVMSEGHPFGHSAGTYGSPGLWGTAWYNDPVREMTTILMIQRGHLGDQRLPMWTEFWGAVYGAE